MADENVVFATDNLQRFAKATPGVFIFGSFVGSLLLTDRRLLFLSAGSSGAAQVLTRGLLGVLTPDSVQLVTASLLKPGSLAVRLENVVSATAERRWDFGRFLRLEYDEGGRRQVTSFIRRGASFDAAWIGEWVAWLGRHRSP